MMEEQTRLQLAGRDSRRCCDPGHGRTDPGVTGPVLAGTHSWGWVAKARRASLGAENKSPPAVTSSLGCGEGGREGSGCCGGDPIPGARA